MRIELQGIEIPIEVEDFITPDWKRVMDFHAEWKEKVIEINGGEAWAMQPYYLGFLKKLVATGHRGRSEQDWTNRINEHFGILGFFETYQERDWKTPGGAVAPAP